MLALHSRRLRRRLSVPTSGSIRRRARERKRAEQTRAEGERLAREKRELRAREKFEQQRKAREELATYQPWGRAGGGAPNARGVRFTKIRDKGIFPKDELRGTSLHEACKLWEPSQRCRSRQTPVKLREDPQICYSDPLRQSVDNDIRYRQTPVEQKNYKDILALMGEAQAQEMSAIQGLVPSPQDAMVIKKKKAAREEVKQALEYERKMHAMEGPWGKPGPGGTLWRNPRDIGLNFSKSMGWTDNEIFTKLKGDHGRYGRSSLALPKVKGDDDYLKDCSDHAKAPGLDKLPGINDYSAAKVRIPEPRNYSVEVKMKNDSKLNGEVRFSPNKTKFVKRLSNGDKVRRILPEDRFESGEVIVVEKKPTPEAAILRVTGGVELVPLLARRRHLGARTLPSSDVTRPPTQSSLMGEAQAQEMSAIQGLVPSPQDAMVIKKKKAAREEVKQALEYERKMHAMEGPWGKPGPGGTLWRNPRDIGLNFSKSMGWTDNEIFTKLKGDHGRYGRSSLALPKVKGDDDYLKDCSDHAKAPGLDKLPGINDYSAAKVRIPEPRNYSVEVKMKNDSKLNGEVRFSPNKTKFVKRLSNGDKVRRILPEDRFESGEVIVVEKKPTPEAAILRVTGGVELVPLLARRRHLGARTLPSSDVTRPPTQSSLMGEAQAQEMSAIQGLVPSPQDAMVIKKKKAAREEVKQALEYERKMHAMEGPWGKPGPGGTLWRNPRDIGLNFSKSMGWTDNEIFTKLKGDHGRYGRSSLALPKVKGDDDYLKDCSDHAKAPGLDKLPGINDYSAAKVRIPEPRNYSVEVKMKNDSKLNGEVRFSPNKTKFVKRLSNGDKVRRILPEDRFESGEVIVVEKKPTPEAAILRVTGGVELVPLLARRRHLGARTLPSSDVTRPPTQSCQWREMLNMDHLRELKQQMQLKCVQKEAKRLDSAESVKRHHETWDSLWGRQGHGAPLRGKYARNNLAQLLYVPRLTNAQ